MSLDLRGSPAASSEPSAGISENLSPPNLFRSFWMGGFECATHINTRGVRLDMMAAVGHDVEAESDYALLASEGMRTARDGVRWHLVDRFGGTDYDWSSFAPMFAAAQRQGTQVIWDICHYGWPDGLDLFTPAFIDRFARFSRALARWIRDQSDETPFFSPMNEISFLAWGASRKLIYPFAEGRDTQVKEQIARAAIAGCEAILDVDPRARFVFPEPIIKVLPPHDRPEFAGQAARENESQFEAWDMIAGLQRPEFGGRARLLDILGANFYHDNQWESPGGRRIHWHVHPRDNRWTPLHELLGAVYTRYRRPLVLAETSHIGVGRGEWIAETAKEVRLARAAGTPVAGICLYPILDRTDWENPAHWHNSGLWDLERTPDGKFLRVLNRSYASALRDSQRLLASVGCV